MRLPRLPEFDGLEPLAERVPLSPGEHRLRRLIADQLHAHDACPRLACRSAAACRSRTVACFDEQRAAIVEAMLDILYEGYAGPPDDDAPF